MNIFCLSDLHLQRIWVAEALTEGKLSPFIEQIKHLFQMVKVDAVVITGDTVQSDMIRYLNALLRTFIPESMPVIVTLGNHEFWMHSFEDTLETLKQQTVADSDIHYLDLVGGIVINGTNFVGGTLFFDGSMRWRENQEITPWEGWNDRCIFDIEKRYKEFNRYYVDMIKSKMKPGMPTVLCTHHVPHHKLNGHEPGHYSFYCGMHDLISELPFDPLYTNSIVCGHTHRRIVGDVLPGFQSVNVGSDYNRLGYFFMEV